MFANHGSTLKATGVYHGGSVTAFYTDAEDEANPAVETTSYTNGTLTLTASADGKTTKKYTIKFAGNKKDASYQIDNGDFEDWTDDNTWR